MTVNQETAVNMLTPAVKKKETLDAILAAATERKGLAVEQIEEIVAAHGDTVTWLAPAPGVKLAEEATS